VTRQTKHGAITVRREDPSTIYVRMEGYISGALVDEHRATFTKILAERATPYWLFDLLDISGFEPSAVPSGGEWWKAFKSQGGSHVLFVTSFGAARMAASALGFSVGVKIIVCGSLSEGRSELTRLRPPTLSPR
jgi:hypothetical protein